MSVKFARAALPALLLAACATQGAAVQLILSPPPSLSVEERSALVTQCQQEAAHARAPSRGAVVNYTNTTAMIVTLAFMGFMQGRADGAAMRSALPKCLLNHGYTNVELTPEERAQWEALPEGPERETFIAPIAQAQRERAEADRVALAAATPADGAVAPSESPAPKPLPAQ